VRIFVRRPLLGKGRRPTFVQSPISYLLIGLFGAWRHLASYRVAPGRIGGRLAGSTEKVLNFRVSYPSGIIRRTSPSICSSRVVPSIRSDGGQVPENKETIDVTSERRKLRWAWVGLGTYFLIFLNATRYASRVPYQIFILGALINAAIITVLILAMRRAYRRLRNAPPRP
jgi:hypothetical protein